MILVGGKRRGGFPRGFLILKQPSAPEPHEIINESGST